MSAGMPEDMLDKDIRTCSLSEQVGLMAEQTVAMNRSWIIFHNKCENACQFGARTHVRNTRRKMCQSRCQTSRQGKCQNMLEQGNQNTFQDTLQP